MMAGDPGSTSKYPRLALPAPPPWQKKCERGWKWVKVGEKSKNAIPNVEEASKPTLGATMMPLVSQSMGLQYG